MHLYSIGVFWIMMFSSLFSMELQITEFIFPEKQAKNNFKPVSINWKFTTHTLQSLSHNNLSIQKERELTKNETEKLNKIQCILQESKLKLLDLATDCALEHILGTNTFDNYRWYAHKINYLKLDLKMIDNILKDNKTIFSKKELNEYIEKFSDKK